MSRSPIRSRNPSASSQRKAKAIVKDLSRTPPKRERREWSAKREVVPPAPAKDLKEIFNKFSGGADEIDGKTFAKIARDCKIINEKCTIIDIDIIFAKSKRKNLRKINYE